MKYNNKILEAINRGIGIALDDYEDIEKNEPISSKHDIIKSNDMKNYIQIKMNFVDLGLPSGTLWAKWNLGAKNEYEIGNYYAWGEITPKSEYTWNNYKFGNDPLNLTKYKYRSETDKRLGIREDCDNITVLEDIDDAAYQNIHIGNYKFHIPTKEQFDELKENTDNYWCATDGLDGWLFIGKNGNKLYMPKTGRYNDDKLMEYEKTGWYWTSSLKLYTDYSNDAHHFMFYNGVLGCGTNNFGYSRKSGMPIRPVLNK